LPYNNRNNTIIDIASKCVQSLEGSVLQRIVAATETILAFTLGTKRKSERDDRRWFHIGNRRRHWSYDIGQEANAMALEVSQME